MTRQRKDDGAVPEGRRKPIPTQDKLGGGKSVTVDEQTGQLYLFPEPVEEMGQPIPEPESVTAYRITDSGMEPLFGNMRKNEQLTTMEIICSYLREAFANVISNKGAPGPDRQTVTKVKENGSEILCQLQELLLGGEYQVGDIRRVWIPKSGGGERGLGIPNVIDRIVQEAVRLTLDPLYDERFSEHSHGFRTGRGCQTAIAEAKKYLEEGHDWVVDIDLKDFFNRVNHQRLLTTLSKDIEDKRVLKLIGMMLKAKVVMPDGVKVSNDEGVPQGGPLSPLLSNIVLDELDKELELRGHKFVRYADDCNIYVRSEKAGQRTMASIRRFIEKRLRLQINEDKSAVAKPETRHFLGFRLYRDPLDGDVKVLLSKRSHERIKDKSKMMTRRNYGGPIKDCIYRLNLYLRGWMGFFRICTKEELILFGSIDAHIRRRLRAIQLKQWRRKRTIAQQLIRRGANRKTAWQSIYSGRKSLWKLSHIPIVDRVLNNSYWENAGLIPLVRMWKDFSETSECVLHSQG